MQFHEAPHCGVSRAGAQFKPPKVVLVSNSNEALISRRDEGRSSSAIPHHFFYAQVGCLFEESHIEYGYVWSTRNELYLDIAVEEAFDKGQIVIKRMINQIMGRVGGYQLSTDLSWRGALGNPPQRGDRIR